MSMCISTPQARTKRAANFWGAAFFLQILASNGSCDIPMYMSTAQACTKQEIPHRHLAKRPLIESLYRDLAKRPLMEILFRDLAKKPLTEILPTELLFRSCTEILPGHLFWRPCAETLHRDLLQRSCQEVSYINLAKRAFLESLRRDLLKRSCQEISYRDLVQEVLPRDLLSKEVWKSNFRQYWQMKSRGGKSQRQKRRKKKMKEGQRRERVRREKMKVREKVEKSAKPRVFPMICGSGGSKSRLPQAAGAEPSGEIRDERLHAVVPRSTFLIKNVQSTSAPKHFWKLRCRKSARCCGAKQISKSKCTKHLSFGAFRSTFGSWDVEKVHAVVARSTCRSHNVQSTPASERF